MILHHGFDDVLVSEGVLARGVEDSDWSFADHGGNVQVVDGVNRFSGAPNANLAEIHVVLSLNDAVDIAAAFSRSSFGSVGGFPYSDVQVFPVVTGALARRAHGFDRHIFFPLRHD